MITLADYTDRTVAVALVVGAHPELPAPYSITLERSIAHDRDVAMHLMTLADLSTWAAAFQANVELLEQQGQVMVSTTLVVEGIRIQGWVHMAYRDAYKLVAHLGADFRDRKAEVSHTEFAAALDAQVLV